MATRVISKPTMQLILRELRMKGLPVTRTRDKAGYTIHEGDDLVLKAMQGKASYLLYYDEEWWDSYNAQRVKPVKLPA